MHRIQPLDHKINSIIISWYSHMISHFTKLIDKVVVLKGHCILLLHHAYWLYQPPHLNVLLYMCKFRVLWLVFATIANCFCYNGGTCVYPNECACTPRWTGTRCETREWITWRTPRGIVSEVPYNVGCKVVHSYWLYTTLTLSYLPWWVPEWWTVCETRHM